MRTGYKIMNTVEQINFLSRHVYDVEMSCNCDADFDVLADEYSEFLEDNDFAIDVRPGMQPENLMYELKKILPVQ